MEMTKMSRFATVVLTLIILIGLVVAASGQDGKKAEPKAKKELPADIEKITPQYTGEDRAEFVHPIRNENNKFVTIETNYGRMVAELYHDLAPAHADSFVARSADGFYDSTIFHRVVAGFMIQGGSVTANNNRKMVDYTIDAETSDAKHYEGTLSMARRPDPNSATTQFFVCLNRGRSTSSLDKTYTVFGQLISGYDTLFKIGAVECELMGREKSKPVKTILLQKAYVSDSKGNPITK